MADGGADTLSNMDVLIMSSILLNLAYNDVVVSKKMVLLHHHLRYYHKSNIIVFCIHNNTNVFQFQFVSSSFNRFSPFEHAIYSCAGLQCRQQRPVQQSIIRSNRLSMAKFMLAEWNQDHLVVFVQQTQQYHQCLCKFPWV